MKDMERNENIREIVNGAQLARFANKPISLTGLVVDVDNNNLSFNLRSVDNIIVPVSLRKPLTRPIEGYVEVHGISQGKSIVANDLIIFNNQEFDVKGHNSLCNFLYSVPNLWDIKNQPQM